MAKSMDEINTAVPVVLSQITAANNFKLTLKMKSASRLTLFNPGWIYEIA